MFCNLAGFILKAREGEGDSTPDDITAMVKAQITPPHRSAGNWAGNTALITCLPECRLLHVVGY